MYECKNKCLCAKCIHVKGNCATCKIQWEKKFSKKVIKQCVSGGVKECKYFKEIKDSD